MKCPKCDTEVTEYQINCHYCGYLFDKYYEKLYNNILGKVIYPLIIDETIKKYSTIPINHYKPKKDAKIIFKNITTKDISRSLSNKLSYEESVIDFYKQNGYDAFFAENIYWLILYSMIYDYENFVNSIFTYELLSDNIPTAREGITKINFNSPKHIPNITNQIIKAYFKNICPRVPPQEFYNKDYYCGLRNNFRVNQFIITPSYLTEKQLILIFERMFDDLKYYSYGLPDLIVYNDNEFFFVEVKSKTDTPSFKQIQWHKFLAEVVGIDVVLFMIDKSDEQIINIKKSYDIELEDSKKRKQKANDDNKKISIDWNSNDLKQNMVKVSNDDFNKLIDLRHYYSHRYEKYVVNEYTRLTYKDFSKEEWSYYRKLRSAKINDLVYQKARELYSFNVFEDFTPTKKQLERNKKAKSFENNGNYYDAVNQYMVNVIEKTGSPVTYKRLIYIFNKFDRFYDVVKLMDIAIPIFITLNDKTNALRFIYQKFAAMNGNKSMPAMETISNSDLKLNRKKNSDKQADLSSYFN